MKPTRAPSTHRQTQLMPERIHDPYHNEEKFPEPSVCSECGATWHRGHWTWLARPKGAHEVVCPACRRIREHLPAGTLHVSGPYYIAHREELLNLLRHHEEHAKREHPLHRIMSWQETNEDLTITTTDPHLARGLGEALRHAHHGNLDYAHAPGAPTIEVKWHR